MRVAAWQQTWWSNILECSNSVRHQEARHEKVWNFKKKTSQTFYLKCLTSTSTLLMLNTRIWQRSASHWGILQCKVSLGPDIWRKKYCLTQLSPSFVAQGTSGVVFHVLHWSVIMQKLAARQLFWPCGSEELKRNGNNSENGVPSRKSKVWGIVWESDCRKTVRMSWLFFCCLR